MKLITDEHISPRIARAVQDIALRREWSLETIIGSTAYRGREDEDWVGLFAKTGGHGLISADRQMLKRPTMIGKITQLGLVGVFLPAEWAESRRHYQAAHILYWWPRIADCFDASPKGSAWIVPKGMGSGELRAYGGKNVQARRSEAG